MENRKIINSLILSATLLGLVACGRSGQLTVPGESSEPETSAVLEPTIEAEAPEKVPSPAIDPIETKKPIVSVVTFEPVTEVKMPLSEATGIELLNKNHQAYADYTGTSLLGVQMLYQENFASGPVDFATDVNSFDRFLKFAYQVDPVLRKWLDEARLENQMVHEAMAKGNLANFVDHVSYLSADFSIHITPRIVKAAQIYQLPITSQPYVEGGLMEASYKSALDNFVEQSAVKFGVDPKTNPPLVPAIRKLLASVTLNYSTSASSGGQTALADFAGPAKLVGFEADQGGFGVTAISLVGFVPELLSFEPITESRVELKPVYNFDPKTEYSYKL